MKHSEFKKELFKSRELRKIREKNRLAYDIANLVLDARIKKGLTQVQLARKIGTKQPSIARVENGDYLPTLTFLEKIANALDVKLVTPSFSLLGNYESGLDGFVTGSDAVVCSGGFELGAISFKFEIKNNSSETENLGLLSLEECHG